jgi:hypothetical protein
MAGLAFLALAGGAAAFWGLRQPEAKSAEPTSADVRAVSPDGGTGEPLSDPRLCAMLPRPAPETDLSPKLAGRGSMAPPVALPVPKVSAGETFPTPKPLPEILDGNSRRLDRPDGEYRIEALSRGTTLKLAGQVRVLRVGSVGGESTLDASALSARRVIVTGKIDGDATVKLNAPGGDVVFREPVAGDAELAVTAREVEFRGILDGEATRVTVTLTKGGLLAFREIAGAVHLLYRKADPRDPDPRVVGGGINDGARLRRID